MTPEQEVEAVQAKLSGAAVEVWAVCIGTYHPQLYAKRPTPSAKKACPCGCGHLVEFWSSFPDGAQSTVPFNSPIGKLMFEKAGSGGCVKLLVAVVPDGG